MKLDTSKPKDWRAFVSSLCPVGLEKLLLQHCEPAMWEFPLIVLALEPFQQPFLNSETVERIRLKLCEHFECNNIDLKVFIRMEDRNLYSNKGFTDRAKLTIFNEINKRIELKEKSKDVYLALCPFHEEKTPSFSVHMDKSFYNCFGCGVNGTLESLPKAFDDFHGRPHKDTRKERLKCLEFARIKCKQIIVHIDYQFANYDPNAHWDVKMDDILKKLSQLNDDIRQALKS